MAHSGRERHRDREPGRRRLDDAEQPAGKRVFRITDDQRRLVMKSLRYIDDARRALESQQNRDNREIIRELRVSADKIFDLLNDLEETDA